MPSKAPPEIREARFLGKRFLRRTRQRVLADDPPVVWWETKSGPIQCIAESVDGLWYVVAKLKRPQCRMTLVNLEARRSLPKALAAAEAACRRFYARFGKALGVKQ